MLKKTSSFLENKNNNLFWCLIVIILAQIFVQLILYGGNNFLISGGDISFPLKVGNRFFESFFLWDTKHGTGEFSPTNPTLLTPFYTLLFIFSKLGLSLISSQKLLFGSVLAFSGLAMYFSAKILFSVETENHKIASFEAFIAALFYMFNDYTLTLWRGPEFKYLLGYSILPLLLAIIIKGVSLGKLKYLLIVSLFSVLFASTAINPVYIAVIMIAAVIYFLYNLLFLLLTRNYKKAMFSFVITATAFLAYILINFWWIAPVFRSVPETKLIITQDMEGDNWLNWKSSSKNMVNQFLMRRGSTKKIYPDLSNPKLLLIVFIFPLLAFSVLLWKRSKLFLYFGFLAILGIFLSKGLNYPFGFIYGFLHSKVPFFWIFRSLEWFIPLTVVSYSFLIFFSIFYLSEKADDYKEDLGGYVKLLIFFLISIYLATFWRKSPLDSDLRLEPSGPYLESASWLNDQPEDFKVLPTRPSSNGYYQHQSGFSGDIFYYLSNKPVVNTAYGQGSYSQAVAKTAYDLLYTNKQVLSEKALGILNIKYLVDYKDVTNNDYLYSGRYVSGCNNPTIGPILSAKERAGLSWNFGEVVLFENQYFLPHIYVPKIKYLAKDSDITNLQDVLTINKDQPIPAIYLKTTDSQKSEKETYLKESTNTIFVQAELESKISDEELKNAKSPLGTDLPAVKIKPDSMFYGLIRKEEEIKKWLARDKLEELFNLHLFYANKRVAEIKNWERLTDVESKINQLDEYDQEIESATDILNELNNKNDKNFYQLLIKIKLYLSSSRLLFIDLNYDKRIIEKFRDILEKIENKLVDYEMKYRSDFSNIVYKIDVPEDGEYKIFLQTKNEEWEEIDSKFFVKGEQKFTIPVKGQTERLLDINDRILGYSHNSIYKISVDYKSQENGQLSVDEDECDNLFEIKLFSTGKNYKHLESFFKSSPVGNGAIVSLVDVNGKTIDYKNLKILEIFQQNIILVKNKPIGDTIPSITFSKLNPTKYKVLVEGARAPFTLIFSESFQSGWKLYINGLTDSKINELKNYGVTVASYFDGEIKEGTHKNIFLDKNTFESWSKKPIPEERHLMVNGFANSWYILPDDSDGFQDYEVTIEFVPQRMVYFGFLLSSLSILIFSAVLIRLLVKNE